MRMSTILLIGVLALIPSAGGAETSRRVDPLVFSVHVDLLSQFDLADLRRALEERVRDEPSTTDELRVHVREAQRLCDRVVREGLDQVFGSAAVP